MSKNPLEFLELLERRVLPNKQEEVRIVLGNAPVETMEKKRKQVSTLVVDKRRDAVIDREATLARLRDKNVFIVKPLLAVKMSEIVETKIQGIEEEPDMTEKAAPLELSQAKPVVEKKRRLVLKVKADERKAPQPDERKDEKPEEPEPKKRGRKLKIKGAVEEETGPVDLTTVMIRSQTVADRLPITDCP